MHINDTGISKQRFKFEYTKTSVSIFFISLLIFALYVGIDKYKAYKTEEKQTRAIISNPQINDIYFLDFRLLSDKLRPHEKYRIAKVVDITGDIVTLLYGGFFYQRQHAVINSIKFGQLSFKDYFESKRYDIPKSTIVTMHNNEAIYLAKRPVRYTLFGNVIGPDMPRESSNKFVYGKTENDKGNAFLKEKFSETNLETAYEYFVRSSDLGYAKGQVNLAQMYINGQHISKDLDKALHWLKQGAMQSYKPAILKYEIICKQVDSCDIAEFYQSLVDAGVNIKVRSIDFKLGR